MMPDLLEFSENADIEFPENGEVARLDTIPVVIEAANENVSFNPPKTAGLANLGQNFLCDPLLKLLCLWFGALENELIKAGFIYDCDFCSPA